MNVLVIALVLEILSRELEEDRMSRNDGQVTAYQTEMAFDRLKTNLW